MRAVTKRDDDDDDDDDDDASRARRWEESFLSSSSAGQQVLLASTVSYSSPVEYTYGEGEVTSMTTPSTVMYQQQLASDVFVDVIKTSRARRRELSGYESRVVRFFKPDQSTVLVRWRAEWGGSGGESGGKRKGGTAVEGQTKYRLRPAEGSPGSEKQVISSVEETWDFSSRGTDRVRFLEALGFCMAHAPPPLGPLPVLDFLPAVKLAAWQALKDDPNYGGNLIREELDVITVNAVIAFGALCFSTSLLMVEVISICVFGKVL